MGAGQLPVQQHLPRRSMEWGGERKREKAMCREQLWEGNAGLRDIKQGSLL